MLETRAMVLADLAFDRVMTGEQSADKIVEYAEANDMLVRGHTLVWHRQLPAWVEQGDWTRDELLEVLRGHITTVVGRYKGRIAAWDVVNNAMQIMGGIGYTQVYPIERALRDFVVAAGSVPETLATAT